ncbi:MAG: HAD family phosphatase [Acidobacteria bacterium]|nr:HAD family phosphatase [Acidobacteriota bacterium]
MLEPTALFWDVGGVLLSNGWDRAARRRAIDQFRLDREEFEDRHELVVSAFEKGQLGLEDYLKRTVFYEPRAFTRQQFEEFLFAQSKPDPETLNIVDRLARSRKYLLATLNNESQELNEYRISHFGLRTYFMVFFSSCYLGVRKPDEAIYRLALHLTGRTPEECLFIDDRALNVECAQRCGMRTIHFHDPVQLLQDLRLIGVEV